MLVFYHIPKTAGTSSRRVIEAWFPTIYRDYDYRSAQIDASADTSGICLIGHFAARLVGHELALLDLLPTLKAPNPDTLFTVLREPLDHAVSAYYHMRDVDKDRLGSLGEFLENGHPFQSSVVLGISGSDCIAAALDSFAVVGDTSDLQKSFDVLADQMGKPRLEVPTVRVGTRDTQVISLNASERSRFEKMWPLDYEIYEAARERLARGAGAANRQFFPHADKTSAVTNAALSRQNAVRIQWSERPESAIDVAPILPLEFRLLLDKKDARIRELEQKVASVEERSKSLLERIVREGQKLETERAAMKSKLQGAQDANAELKAAIEKQTQKVKRYQQQLDPPQIHRDSVAIADAATIQFPAHADATAEHAGRRKTAASESPAPSAARGVAPAVLEASASQPAPNGADAAQPKPDFVGSIGDLKSVLHEINLLLTELNTK